MAITRTVAGRNAAADAEVNLLDVGVGNATCELWDAGVTTKLVTITLQKPAFGSAAAGVKTLLGVPLTNNGIATGQHAVAIFKDGDGQEVFRCSSGISGTDLIADKVQVTNANPVTINSFTFTAV